MLTKFRTMFHVKLVAVSLIGLMLLTSCGGGGEDANNDDRTEPIEPPDRVVLSLSELTQDTSQGKTIIVDYQGSAFDEGDLSVSVGDTFVESAFLNEQIHLILPLTQLGETSLEFNFGGFSSSLSVDITAAPAIADPPAYVSSVVEDFVAELDTLPEGDWEDEVDALRVAEQALSELSADEIREVAVFLKQNFEPLLRQSNSPVVAQYDEATCRQAINRFLTRKATVAIVIAGVAIYTLVPEPSKMVGLSIGLGALALAIWRSQDAAGKVMATCLNTVVAEFQADLVTTSGVRVAQQDPETISTIHFDEGQARAVTITLAHRFEHEKRPEVLSAIRDLGDLLLRLNDGLRSVVDILPGFLSGLAGGINSFIAKFDGFISTFAGLENPDRVEAANHADFRLEGISDANVSGSITTANSEKLFLTFRFVDRSLVPAAGYVDFSFTLSNPVDDLGDIDVLGRLFASDDVVTVEILSATCTYVRTDTGLFVDGSSYSDRVYKSVVTARATGPVGTEVYGSIDVVSSYGGTTGTGCYASNWSVDTDSYGSCVRGSGEPESTIFTTTIEVLNAGGTRWARAHAVWNDSYATTYLEGIVCQ